MAEQEKENSDNGSKVSRRTFLKTAAVGAAGLGVAAATPALLAGKSAPWGTAMDAVPDGMEGSPIVAYVTDARAGEIVLMVGTREVRLRNFGLVSWLARAVAGV